MPLFYRKIGQGKPFIILHGLFGNSDHWVSIGKKIADLGYEVFILDQRNHGQSPKNALLNYLVLTDDLFEFIQEHKLDKPIIMGHSMGGKVAMRFALENPSYISRLIVIDISLRAYKIPSQLTYILMAMEAVDFEIISSRQQVDLVLKKHISDPKIRMLIMKNLQRIDKNRYEWRIYLDAISNNKNLLFENIEIDQSNYCSTLFIRGGISDYILDSDIQDIEKAFPNAQIQTIEGADHWVHVEAPEVFITLVSEFVNH